MLNGKRNVMSKETSELNAIENIFEVLVEKWTKHTDEEYTPLVEELLWKEAESMYYESHD